MDRVTSGNTLLTPLGRLGAPDLREVVRELLDGAVESVSPGWPRMLSPATDSSWLRGSDLAVELGARPPRGPFEIALVLTAASATRVVDRLLGAPSETGVPSASGAPSEVECGLLAYIAARLCVAWGSDLTIREVRRCAESMPLAEAVLWPLSLATNFGALECSLLLVPELAARIEELPLTVALTDRLAPDTSLSRVGVGDLLVGDHWLMSATTEGLCGQVQLLVSGASSAFDGTLERGLIRARTPRPLRDDLALVLAERSCTLLELARLTSGETLPVTIPPTATLRHGDVTVACGELVRDRGRIGIRVDTLGDEVAARD
jgi:hypothetical protein